MCYPPQQMCYPSNIQAFLFSLSLSFINFHGGILSMPGICLKTSMFFFYPNNEKCSTSWILFSIQVVVLNTTSDASSKRRGPQETPFSPKKRNNWSQRKSNEGPISFSALCTPFASWSKHFCGSPTLTFTQNERIHQSTFNLEFPEKDLQRTNQQSPYLLKR